MVCISFDSFLSRRMIGNWFFEVKGGLSLFGLEDENFSLRNQHLKCSGKLTYKTGIFIMSPADIINGNIFVCQTQPFSLSNSIFRNERGRIKITGCQERFAPTAVKLGLISSFRHKSANWHAPLNSSRTKRIFFSENLVLVLRLLFQ